MAHCRTVPRIEEIEPFAAWVKRSHSNIIKRLHRALLASAFGLLIAWLASKSSKRCRPFLIAIPSEAPN